MERLLLTYPTPADFHMLRSPEKVLLWQACVFCLGLALRHANRVIVDYARAARRRCECRRPRCF